MSNSNTSALLTSARFFGVVRFLALVFIASLGTPSWAADAKINFNVSEGDAATALKQLAKQAGQQVVFPGQDVKGVTTPAIRGEYSLKEALNLALANTGLEAKFDTTTGTFAVSRAALPNVQRAAQMPKSDRPNASLDEEPVRLGRFEVMDSKLLNMDIRRTTDDAQAYVILDRDRVRQSGAINLDDLFRSELTMNTPSVSYANTQNTYGSKSNIDLRGLGSAATLILIDGRRAGVGSGGDGSGSTQPDVNGIPMAAIERIEILPTTASAIYGAEAAGGVINIILRRDYQGAEVKLTYDNSFRSDSARKSVDFSAGMSLENGRTSVLIAGSYRTTNVLSSQDRDFYQDAIQRLIQNSPDQIYSPASPRTGYTTNIRSASGNLVLRNGTPLNSPYTFVPVGYAGPQGDNGAALATNAGRYNFNYANSGQIGGGLRSIIKEPITKSFMLSVRRKFNPWLDVFAEAHSSSNLSFYTQSTATTANTTVTIPAGAVGNPFLGAVQIAVPDLLMYRQTAPRHDHKYAVGFVASLPRDWKASADLTYSSAEYQFASGSGISTAFVTDIASGKINPFRDVNLNPIDLTPYYTTVTSITPAGADSTDLNFRLAGPVLELTKGRPITAALAVEDMKVYIDDDTRYTATQTLYFPDKSLDRRSASVQLNIPVVQPKNAIPWVNELKFEVAGRYDQYTINSSSASINLAAASTTPVVRATKRSGSSNPTVAVRYAVSPDLAIRASYATGFQAPGFSSLISTPSSTTVTYTDPRRGNAIVQLATPGAYIIGGNPSLRPESSKSVALGLIATPRVLPGLRLSVDYTKLSKTDAIGTYPTGPQGLINDEAKYPGRITRGPALAGDPAGWPGPIQVLDFTQFNLASATYEVIDGQISYELKLGNGGRVRAGGNATYQLTRDARLANGLPVQSSLGIASAGARSRFNASLSWSKGPLLIGWNAQFTHSYQVDSGFGASPQNIVRQGNGGKVDGQIYHNLFAQYDFKVSHLEGISRKIMGDSQIQVGVRNVFNKPPPFDINQSDANNYISPVGDPRMATYYLSFSRKL